MAKQKIILCDTSIFIALLRGDNSVKKQLDKIGFKNVGIHAVVGVRKTLANVSRTKSIKFSVFRHQQPPVLRVVGVEIAGFEM